MGWVLSQNEGEGGGGCTLCLPQLQLQARWLRAPRLCRDRGHGSPRKIRLRGQSRQCCRPPGFKMQMGSTETMGTAAPWGSQVSLVSYVQAWPQGEPACLQRPIFG